MPRARLLDLLGLPLVATPDEIKARYRELARRYHPDVNAGDDRAHVRLRAITAAYEELLAADLTPAAAEHDRGAAPAATAPQRELGRHRQWARVPPRLGAHRPCAEDDAIPPPRPGRRPR